MDVDYDKTEKNNCGVQTWGRERKSNFGAVARKCGVAAADSVADFGGRFVVDPRPGQPAGSSVGNTSRPFLVD